MKKKVLTIIGLVAVVAILSTGAFAYFDSATTNTGNISSGTLTLKVAGVNQLPDGLTCNGVSGYGNSTTIWSMANMAPGDVVEGYLCMKNIGTIAARQVTFDWVYNAQLGDLADHIFVTDIRDSTDTGNMIGYFDCYKDDHVCKLSELAAWSGSYQEQFDAWTTVDPFLPAGGPPKWLKMTFQFDPAAGNEFQGKGFTYDLIVTAEQIPVK